jgi:RNA polymerase sigma-B factor
MSATTLAPPIHGARPNRPVPRDRREAEDLALLDRYHESGDLHARDELTERFLPLARELALRYRHTDEPLEDLTQVACLGLVKAVDRFQPDRGTRFMSYAVPTILGELKRHFRDKGWALHVPRDLQERALAVGRARETLSKKLGRSPSVKEVAAGLCCGVEDVLEASEAATAYDTASLQAPIGSRAGDEETALLGDTLGGEDQGYDFVELRGAVSDAWADLPAREREIVRLRFAEDLTQREIGERVGISQMHVSRLLRRALDRLQAAARAA